MPILRNAIRKLRSDKRRSAVNQKVRRKAKETVSSMRKKPTVKTLESLFSALDKAVKGRVIHKNKAARLKSRLSKLMKK